MLNELVGTPGAGGSIIFIAAVAIMFGFFYGTDDWIGRLGMAIPLMLAVWGALRWRAFRKHNQWVASLPVATKLAILDSLYAESIIDEQCRDQYADRLPLDS